MELALETIRVLRRFKNAVLEGPPGTGKSHVVGKVADLWQQETGRPLAGRGRGAYAITLHPNTTYEEFVEGLRYDDDDEKFKRKDGFLRRIIAEAERNPDSDYLVLIDELNRANVPKVFGDLLLTMEASKRTEWDGAAWRGGMEVTLPYSEQPFSVPSNVYLLGTMNTSDRSIAPLDSALRRRFGFVRVEPMLGESLRSAIEVVDGSDAAARVARSIDELTNLNEALRQSLGPNAMLGHSYLFGVTATTGAVAPPSDPLADLRAAAAESDATGAFWVEARVLDGGSHNQLGLPAADESTKRKGIVDSFFPMSSNGVATQVRSSRDAHYKVEIEYDGNRYLDNVVRFNAGGPNYKVYFLGKTATGQKFSSVGATGILDHKMHVFLRRSDDTLKLVLLDRNDPVIAALRSVSVPPSGWHEQTSGGGKRSYGVVDLAALAASGTTLPTPDEDAEWMIWRYAILPQLVETTTQVGATELLARATRDSWLDAAGVSDVADRWAKFDRFLDGLSLAVEEEGFGLTRGLTVVDMPAGAAVQSVDDTDEADENGSGSDDAE